MDPEPIKYLDSACLGEANTTGSEVLKVSRKWQRGYYSDHLGVMIGGRLQNILFWLCAYRPAAI